MLSIMKLGGKNTEWDTFHRQAKLLLQKKVNSEGPF